MRAEAGFREEVVAAQRNPSRRDRLADVALAYHAMVAGLLRDYVREMDALGMVFACAFGAVLAIM